MTEPPAASGQEDDNKPRRKQMTRVSAILHKGVSNHHAKVPILPSQLIAINEEREERLPNANF